MATLADTQIANLLDGTGLPAVLLPDDTVGGGARDDVPESGGPSAATGLTDALALQGPALAGATHGLEVVPGDAIQGDGVVASAAGRSGDAALAAAPAAAPDSGDPHGGYAGAAVIADTGGCVAPGWIGSDGWTDDPVRGLPWYEGPDGDWVWKIPGDDIVLDDGSGYDVAGGGADIDGDGIADDVPGDYGAYTYYGGYTTTAIGDVNGDGFEDYLVEGYGQSYTWYGYESIEVVYDGDGAGAEGDGQHDYAGYGGYYSYSAGDVNGDGLEDFVVGGYGYVYLQYGVESADAAYGGDVQIGIVADDDGSAVPADEPYLVYGYDPAGGAVLEPGTPDDPYAAWSRHEIFTVDAGDGEVVIALEGWSGIAVAGGMLSVAGALPGGGAIVPVDL